MIAEFLVFAVTFLVVYYVYSYRKIQGYYTEKGLKFLPGIPFFGNTFKNLMGKRHIIDDINVVYKAFPEDRYAIYFEGVTPIIIIRDPEIVKNITVKDFDHWVDHRKFFQNDELFGLSLFSMTGDEWRDMRTTLSPAFTGSKMRQMLPFMAEISLNIVDYLKNHQNEDIDVDDLIRRYTNDVIASTAFGLQINSLKDPENEFFLEGQTLFKFTTAQKFKMFVMAQFPYIAQKLNIQIFSQATKEFFTSIVTNTMDYREKNNVDRPDMIQLLMQASKGTLKKEVNAKEDTSGFTVDESLTPTKSNRQWSIAQLVGQVFLFFGAGFETSATSVALTIHELALNEKVEEKLYQEIIAFEEKHKTLTFDNLSELKYLDSVVSETLRKWSPAIILDRVCLKPYQLPPPREGGKPFMVKPGAIVYNLVNSLHLDAKYYPEPEKYDPERFSEENRHKIKPFTYMPFGSGPRNCIGVRFAMMELKVVLFYLVKYFKITKCDKTSNPIILEPTDFNLRAINKTWVKFQSRD